MFPSLLILKKPFYYKGVLRLQRTPGLPPDSELFSNPEKNLEQEVVSNDLRASQYFNNLIPMLLLIPLKRFFISGFGPALVN
jgi:hypothetical protein